MGLPPPPYLMVIVGDRERRANAKLISALKGEPERIERVKTSSMLQEALVVTDVTGKCKFGLFCMTSFKFHF